MTNTSDYSIVFFNEKGKEIKVDPNGRFKMAIDTNGMRQMLLDCYATLTVTNIPSEPYEIYTVNHR